MADIMSAWPTNRDGSARQVAIPDGPKGLARIVSRSADVWPLEFRETVHKPPGRGFQRKPILLVRSANSRQLLTCA